MLYFWIMPPRWGIGYSFPLWAPWGAGQLPPKNWLCGVQGRWTLGTWAQLQQPILFLMCFSLPLTGVGFIYLFILRNLSLLNQGLKHRVRSKHRLQ